MSGRGRRFLIFTLCGDRFAMNVSDLAEVMETTPTFPIPKAPKSFLGVMNFHGAPIPVLDLASFLHGDPPKSAGRILILDHKIGSLALRIDTVERIVSDIRGLQIQQDEGSYVRQSILFNTDKIPLFALDILMTELENEVRTGCKKSESCPGVKEEKE
ncbi:MAG: chemotaxis protein CheW [Geobacter sp.]|nr:MAG: chemotaxis protein CheW [Geobacter sp.]